MTLLETALAVPMRHRPKQKLTAVQLWCEVVVAYIGAAAGNPGACDDRSVGTALEQACSAIEVADYIVAKYRERWGNA